MRSLVEKYRPRTWDDIVGQDQIVYSLKNQNPNSRPNLLFLGKSGTGKTTVANVYAKMNNIPMEILNASDERGIKLVRTKIKDLGRTKSRKIIFLDEADNLTSEAQDALRATMEVPTETIFILSGNKGGKIIEPIKSRCTEYRFNRLDDSVVLKKIIDICKQENVKWTKGCRDGFKQLIRQCRGDLRKAINTLEAILEKGETISEKTVSSFIKPQISDEIIETAYGGDFQKARETLEDAFINSNLDPSSLISDLYESIGNKIHKDKHCVKLYIELAKTDRGLNRDVTNDLLQLVGFISYVWLVPHLSDTCPVLKEDYDPI